jgi:uncharacterized protein (DUF362 family)
MSATACCRNPQLRVLDSSRSAIPADPDLPLFDYDRDGSSAAGVTEHLLHPVPALQHIDVFEQDPLLLEVLTGFRCIGSRVLAENKHFLLHGAPPLLHNMTAMRSAREFSPPRLLRRRDFALTAPFLGAAIAAFGRQEDQAEAEVPVAIVQGADRRKAIRLAWDMLAEPGFSGKSIWLKASYNSPHPFPATTHPESLRTVIEILRESGCGTVTLVERSGMGDTRDVWRALGVPAIAREIGLEALALEDLPASEWETCVFAGSHWKQGFEIPKPLQEGAVVVQICNLRTHRFGAHYSASLKNALGVVAKYSSSAEKRNYMVELHDSPDQRLMIAEVNQAFSPAVTFMDAMKVFVSEGPERGEVAGPGVIAASRDRVALDAVGFALLRLYNARLPGRRRNVFEQEPIKRAAELGLGVRSPEQIRLLTPDAGSETLAVQLKALMANIQVEKE